MGEGPGIVCMTEGGRGEGSVTTCEKKRQLGGQLGVQHVAFR